MATKNHRKPVSAPASPGSCGLFCKPSLVAPGLTHGLCPFMIRTSFVHTLVWAGWIKIYTSYLLFTLDLFLSCNRYMPETEEKYLCRGSHGCH